MPVKARMELPWARAMTFTSLALQRTGTGTEGLTGILRFRIFQGRCTDIFSGVKIAPLPPLGAFPARRGALRYQLTCWL